MPVHSSEHKSKGSKKEKAQKTRGQKTRQGRKGRATRSSRAIVSEYASKLKNGKNTGAMFLAQVVSAPGGGRFHVEDTQSKERVVAHVTPVLSVKSAKYANSSDEFSIRVGSHVLVDGNIIKAVVPRQRLSAIREEEASSIGSHSNLYSITSKSSSGEKSPSSRGKTRKNRH